MKETEDIEFEAISSGIEFEKMGLKSEIDFEKEYDSLYDELLEKCNPDRYCFSPSFDEIKFKIANDIYGNLRNNHTMTQDYLIELRNRAINELEIHFSTKKLYEKLVGYFDPQIYTSMDEYDTQRVAKAGYYYAKTLKAKNDVLTLEEIEKEASGFIEMRNIELQRDLEKKRIEDLERDRKVEKRAVVLGALIFGFILIMAIISIIDTII